MRDRTKDQTQIEIKWCPVCNRVVEHTIANIMGGKMTLCPNVPKDTIIDLASFERAIAKAKGEEL